MRLASILAVGLLLATPAAGDSAGVAEQAEAVGRALTGGRAESLKPVLPAKGKVHLALARLGPEDGMFGPGQVVAVFRSFLSDGRVTAFEVTRVDSDGKTAGVAAARASLTDRDGRSARVGLRLAFRPEDGRWVLREVKEEPE